MSDTIGLDLLINKKNAGSDTLSIASSKHSYTSINDKKSNKKQKQQKGRGVSSSSSSVRSVSPSHFDVRSVMSSKHEKEQNTHARMQHRSRDKDTHSVSSFTTSSNGSSYSASSKSSGSSYSSSSSRSGSQSNRDYYSKRKTQEQILDEKRTMLYKLSRLKHKGYTLSKEFTLTSSLEDMKLEYKRLVTDRKVDNAVALQSTCLVGITAMIELANKSFQLGAKLDGWSQNVKEDINKFTDVFEELYFKHRHRVDWPPELQLVLTLGGSALMFHFTQIFSKTVETAVNQATVENNGMFDFSNLGKFTDIMSMMSSLFSQQSQQTAPMQSHQNQQNQEHTQMRGPSNVDDIMRELNASAFQNTTGKMNNNDRVEVMSTMSESDISEIPEDASGIFPKSRNARPKNGKRTVNL